MVYIAEAHPVDGWQTESNNEQGLRIPQHVSLDDRRTAAESCRTGLSLSIPVLVDAIDNSASIAFSAWPERIYIIGLDGLIAYRGGPGPFEFDPDEARGALGQTLDA